MKTNVWKCIILCYSLTFSHASLSVEPPLIVDPKQKQFDEQTRSTTSSSLLVPDVVAEVSEQAEEEIANIHFAGGTVIPLPILTKQVKPLLRQPFDGQEVSKTLQAITEEYQKRGYPLSYATAAEESFNQGKLTITLIEGYIARSEVIINHQDIREKVSKILAPVLAEKPLQRKTLERAVLLVNRIPGYKFNIQLPKPKTLSGATSIRIEVQRYRSLEPILAFSKQQYSDESLSASIKFNSFDDFFSQATITSLVPLKDKDERYFAFGIENDWLANGLRGSLLVDFYQDKSQSDLLFNGFDLDYQQDTKRLTIDYSLSYPLLLTSEQQLTLGAGIKHVNEDNRYRLDSQGNMVGQVESDVSYSLAQISIDYSQLFGDFALISNLEISNNINLGQSSEEQDGFYDRGFFIYDATVHLRYQFLQYWRADLRLNGVYTNDNIATNEHVSYGGARYGSGYPEGQAEGQRGYGGYLKLLREFSMGKFHMSPYLLMDTAHSEFNQGQLKRNLSSVAIGAEFGEHSIYSFGVEYAQPMEDDNVITGDKSPIYNVRFSWQI